MVVYIIEKKFFHVHLALSPGELKTPKSILVLKTYSILSAQFRVL